jgi:demethylmenaquinone methyltransferase/2-methoxy-6-polyprenyl-1,4-benzoquinol methylase
MSGEPAPIKRTALRIFRGLSGSYDRVLDYATLMQDRRWKGWLATTAGLKPGSRVLDVGCGTCVLEERLRMDCSIVGVDLTEQMLRVAQGKRLRNVASLLLSDGERLPFRDGCFDAVTSCYLVKYCDASVLLAEIGRVLRPGGRLILYDFVRPGGALWPLNSMYVYGGLPVIGRLMRMQHAGTATTFLELPQIIRGRRWDTGFAEAMASAGFTSVERKPLSGGVATGYGATRAEARR